MISLSLNKNIFLALVKSPFDENSLKVYKSAPQHFFFKKLHSCNYLSFVENSLPHFFVRYLESNNKVFCSSTPKNMRFAVHTSLIFDCGANFDCVKNEAKLLWSDLLINEEAPKFGVKVKIRSWDKCSLSFFSLITGCVSIKLNKISCPCDNIFSQEELTKLKNLAITK